MEINVTSANFDEEVLNADTPVLVDFWAPWCGPCRMLSPVISEIAEERSGTLKVCKANVEDDAALAARFKVMSIPTIVLFKGGAAVERTVGAMPKEELCAVIDKHI